MRLLILGGTIFLGRHLVETAISRGHEITLYNRGIHNVELFPGIEKLRGDRDGSLEVLADRQWDAVIDTSGYVPRTVQKSVRLLANRIEHYTFISSISVYADLSKPGIDESSATGILDDDTIEAITGESYGPLKVLCERAAEKLMQGRVLVVRPGLIVGPHDPTDRFTYWPFRFERGGEILVPSPGQNPVQIIDVRDLSSWIITQIEYRRTGVFNAVGPDEPLTMAAFLQNCQDIAKQDPLITWVNPDFLLESGVTPWSELPLWVGGDEYAGMLTVKASKAIKDGLRFRPLGETIRDTMRWAKSRPQDYQWRAGLTSQRELELLNKWHGRNELNPFR